MPKKKTADPSFPLSAVLAAMGAARIPDEKKEGVRAKLLESRPKLGRKPEDDDQDVSDVILLCLPGGLADPPLRVYTAARQVASKYTESTQKAVAKRLAKKARAILKEADQQEAEELRQLRKEVKELKRQLKEMGTKPQS